MTTFIDQVLSFDGLAWLIITVIFAGIVRGFSGFGTALIFMPIAASVTSPVWAIICRVVSGRRRLCLRH